MKRILGWAQCLLLLLLCCRAGAVSADAGTTPQAPLMIAVAADLHLNPVNRDEGIVNPLVPYNMQIVDAFLWDAERSGADVVLLCGDMTNQGRLVQHEALVEKLRKAEEGGLEVYVLPGNHDIGEVSTGQFAQLYADFGYDDAYSRDEDSLSYSVLLGQRLLLMLDTNGYTGYRDTACLTEATLGWMEKQLILAREKGWQVIAAGHYPICTSHSTPVIGKEEAVRLLEAYGVSLYLSGHLHKRCVTVQGGLTELVVDQTIFYPCCYAGLYLEGGDAYRYEPRKIDVSGWAEQYGEGDQNLLRFDAYQNRLEQQRCLGIVERLRRGRQITREEQEQAEDFFYKLSVCREWGTLSRYADLLRAHPGYEILINLGEGTIYSRWIPSVLDDAVPYTTGFVLKKGQIEALEENVN